MFFVSVFLYFILTYLMQVKFGVSTWEMNVLYMNMYVCVCLSSSEKVHYPTFKTYSFGKGSKMLCIE